MGTQPEFWIMIIKEIYMAEYSLWMVPYLYIWLEEIQTLLTGNSSLMKILARQTMLHIQLAVWKAAVLKCFTLALLKDFTMQIMNSYTLILH